MSFCTDCKIDLNDKNAYWKGETEKRLGNRCKKCFNKYCANRWIKRKLEIIKERENKCFDCGQTFHYSVYEFHHREPSNKEFSWQRAKKLTQEKMRKELEKCDMLCANCHRVRHWNSEVE
jgi:NAD-dependent SIR2 family protein deacetylase